MSRSNYDQKYLRLRRKHPLFYYQSFQYHFKGNEFFIDFHFSLGENIHFYPNHVIKLPTHLNWGNLDEKELDQLVFHLGMVELISYWKATCSPQVIVRPFQLNKAQILWWKKLYFEGLGEFFYLNTIETNLSDFMELKSESENVIRLFNTNMHDDHIMIPVGGGKDSIVSIEVLKKFHNSIIPMVVNSRGASKDTIINAGFQLEESILTKRSIDPQLIELNKQGYLNGHTPFSAMLAFLTLLTSRLMGIKYIALSNESSANESTVEGTNINHQYSKSYEFESDFREYYQKYLTNSSDYFSFLRPLSEIQIACLFSKFKHHHASFRSCNAGSKENIWCGKCSKCLFTYVLLSPFISPAKLESIFGKNLLNDLDLKPILKELRGLAETKPFECVGTVSEVELALTQAKDGFFKNVLLESIVKEDNNNKLQEAMKEWNDENSLPKKFEIVLKDFLERCWN